MRVGITLLILGISALIATVVLASYGAIVSVPKDARESQPIWLPPNFELRSVKTVEPGTFKVNLSLEEFQSIASPDRKVLVVYDAFAGNDNAVVEYWQPRDGNSFHYAKAVIPLPRVKNSWPQSLFTNRDRRFNEEKLMFQQIFRKSPWELAGWSLLLCVAGSIALLFGLDMERCENPKKIYNLLQ